MRFLRGKFADAPFALSQPALWHELWHETLRTGGDTRLRSLGGPRAVLASARQALCRRYAWSIAADDNAVRS